jgi:cytidyltransferase-like protein
MKDAREATVAVSGGFDPIHIGHIRYIKEAAKYGEVIVFLNSDEWLTKKKGKPFMCYEERREILEAIRYVHRVVPVIDEGNTVAETIRLHKPNFFAKGGDRTMDNIPEEEKTACKDSNTIILTGVGGGKIQSSSWLIRDALENTR